MDKLQELTDKLFNEGLSKGKAEGEALLAKARKEAEEIVAQANKEAETIVAKARREAEDLATKVNGDLRMAGAQTLQATRTESLRNQLEPFVKNELGKILGSNVEASFSKKIAGGFTIGPKDGSYFISLTDETFRELIGEYLRPTTKKLLFG